MTSYRKQRAERKRLRFSAMGKALIHLRGYLAGTKVT